MHHLVSNLLSLRSFGITSGLELSLSLLGESNSEHSDEIAISGLDINEGLDGTLPFLHNMTNLVSCHVHTIERSQTFLVLNIFNLKLDFPPVLLLRVSVEISERNLEYSSLE